MVDADTTLFTINEQLLKGTSMARVWTDEQKARQAALIHSWKPWKSSTGARTPEGKAASSQNVLRGNENRAKALAAAQAELKAAELKIIQLSKGKIDPRLSRFMHDTIPVAWLK